VSVVVDASVIVAVLVADQRQAAAQAHLERWVGSGEPVVVSPDISAVRSRFFGK
jgi:predicted nucleic acid-binding protein